MSTRRSGSNSIVLRAGLIALALLVSCTTGDRQSPEVAATLDTGEDSTVASPNPTTTTPVVLDSERNVAEASPADAVAPIDWADCGDGFDCGELAVPLDHDEPDGEHITLALIRVPAGSEEPRGSLVVNPGGPGGSGVGFIRRGFRMDDETMRNYHLVGFDPRGIGGSAALSCSIDRTAGPLVDFAPDDEAEADELEQRARRLAQRCERADGERLRHQSTEAMARDLEMIRLGVGDDLLHYVGFSYGTRLGLSYGHLYPDGVGHLVLDGVVDPAQGLAGLLRQQATGFERSFSRLVASCGPSAVNPLSSCPADGVEAAYDDLHRRLERQASGGFGPTELELATLAALYDDASFGGYLIALSSALDGDTSVLESISDRFSSAADVAAYLSVLCIDSNHPVGGEAWTDLADGLDALSPRFGRTIANEVRACAHWPIEPEHEPSEIERGLELLDAPILVIGATGDPATPLANAQAVSTTLGNGRLIIVEAAEHTSYRPGDCVGDLVGDYLNDDLLPHTLVHCSAS